MYRNTCCVTFTRITLPIVRPVIDVSYSVNHFILHIYNSLRDFLVVSRSFVLLLKIYIIFRAY